MKRILLTALMTTLLYAGFGQYNPVLHTVTNKPYGLAQAGPTDARSYYYDAALFKYRPYQSTAEVLAYLNLAKYRDGRFPIIINQGGVLVSGVFTGGSIKKFWFRDGTADANLVEESGETVYLNTAAPEWSVISTLATPPISPATNDKYRVSHTPTAATVFETHRDEIATYTGSVFTYQTATEGDILYDGTTKLAAKKTAAGWINIGPAVALDGGNALDQPLDLGTKDLRNLNFITNGTRRETINQNGLHVYSALTGSGDALYGLTSTGTGQRIALGSNITITDGVINTSGYIRDQNAVRDAMKYKVDSGNTLQSSTQELWITNTSDYRMHTYWSDANTLTTTIFNSTGANSSGTVWNIGSSAANLPGGGGVANFWFAATNFVGYMNAGNANFTGSSGQNYDGWYFGTSSGGWGNSPFSNHTAFISGSGENGGISGESVAGLSIAGGSHYTAFPLNGKGGDLWLGPGPSTGNNVGGVIHFMSTTPSSSGTAETVLDERWRMNGDGTLWFSSITHGSPVTGDFWRSGDHLYFRTSGGTVDVAVGSTGGLVASNNLSDVSSASTSRTNLGVAIGTNVQAYDADLDYLATFTPTANVKTILNAADYSAIRTALGLVIGTNVQAYDADLTTYAGITPSSNVQSVLSAANYAAIKTLLTLNNVDNTSDATKNSAVATVTNKDLSSGTNTFPTFNQNTTGYSTHLVGGNSTTLLGSVPYQSGTNTTTLLAPNTTTTKKFFSQTGTGTNGAIPSWVALTTADLPTGIPNVNLAFSALTINNTSVSLGGSIDTRPVSAFVTGTDFTTTASTATDVTGLSIAVGANKKYRITVSLAIGCNGANGIKLSMTAPTGATWLNGGWVGSAGSAITAKSVKQTGFASLTATAFNTSIDANGFVTLVGYFTTSVTTGNIVVQIASNTATQVSTVFIGSGFDIIEVTP